VRVPYTHEQLRRALATAARDEGVASPEELRTPAARSVSQAQFGEVRGLSREEVFTLCESLLDCRRWPERLVAFDWAFRLRRQYVATDFGTFERWLHEHVDGWGPCDDLCTHALGSFLFAFPECVRRTRRWRKSGNRWVRRGAAVCLVYSARRGQARDAALSAAEDLLLDEDYLVQKGYGWLLKELSNREPDAVFGFVMERKDVMPRTALRYAIEKLEPALRARAMDRT
jgi:3-methyladenine DNA glycosylase AlkD